MGGGCRGLLIYWQIEADCFWFFTEFSMKNLMESTFSQAEIHVESHGNVLVAVSFLHGLTIGELTPKELDFKDRDYQVVVTARVVKKG